MPSLGFIKEYIPIALYVIGIAVNVEVMVETGLLGLVLFCVILVRALLAGIDLARRSDDPFYRGLGLAFTGCVISVIVTNFFGDRWTYIELAVYFWVMWALVERARALLDAAAEPSPPEATGAEPVPAAGPAA